MNWMTLSPEEWTAVRLSLKVALVATLVSLPLGIAIAMALARGRFWGHSLLNGLVLLPLILPPVVTGYILLILFGRRGPIGAFLADTFGIVFSFRWTGAALACGIMGFPLMVRAIRLSIEGVDTHLEEAAGTLGANRAWILAISGSNKRPRRLLLHRFLMHKRDGAFRMMSSLMADRDGCRSAPLDPLIVVFKGHRARMLRMCNTSSPVKTLVIWPVGFNLNPIALLADR